MRTLQQAFAFDIDQIHTLRDGFESIAELVQVGASGSANRPPRESPNVAQHEAIESGYLRGEGQVYEGWVGEWVRSSPVVSTDRIAVNGTV